MIDTPLNEFALIKRYFTRPRKKAFLGVGDDCALLHVPPTQTLAITSDMLVQGRHFFPHTDAKRLGHKALAVNLSDLAAMGAQPTAFTLALALPTAHAAWLADFSDGLFALADQYDCELIGGDTTRAPLITLSITALGYVPAHAALRRDGAQNGDDIWVSGELGDARLALAHIRNEWPHQAPLTRNELAQIYQRLEQPYPRIALGLALANLTTLARQAHHADPSSPPSQITHACAAIDISDGLIGDLTHILERSACGATVNIDALPHSIALAKQPQDIQRRCTLTGGDDYELCFTASSTVRHTIEKLSTSLALPLSRIGKIDAQPGLRLVDQKEQPVIFSQSSFDHFSDTP